MAGGRDGSGPRTLNPLEPGLTMTRLDNEPDLNRPERPRFGEKPERRTAPRPVRDDRAERPFSIQPPRQCFGVAMKLIPRNRKCLL